MFDSVLVHEWRPEKSKTNSAWHLSISTDRIPVTTIRSDEQFIASQIDAFEIESSPLGRGKVSLSWQSHQAGSALTHSVDTGVGSKTAVDTTIYRLSLAGHPGWTGTVQNLRFELIPQRGRQIRVEAVRGIHDELRPERIPSAIATAWKVNLDNDVRNAKLAVPGVPLSHRLTGTSPTELRFTYGVLGHPTFPVQFSVIARVADREPVSLFEAVISAEEGSNRWHAAAVDLSTLPVEAEISLTAAMPSDEDAFQSRVFPFWGHPEILAAAPTKSLPSIVLISIDTLRSDHMSLYGYSRSTTPAIDTWARRWGAVFDNVIAPAPWTLPSHVSMFTGLDALRHGVNFNSPAPDELTMLAEVLRDNGYFTVAVTGGGFLHPQWGFSQGFDSYRYYAESMGFEEELSSNLVHALEVLRRQSGRPVFLFFHTYEVHNPYRARQPFFSSFSSIDPTPYHVRVDQPESQLSTGYLTTPAFTLLTRGKALNGGKFPQELMDLPVDLYDSGIAFTDSMLATLLHSLSADDHDANTLVILTSDHGEMFGEHETFGHASLFEETLRIPLVIADPTGLGAGKRFDQQVRLIDVAPTILDLLGLETQENLDGRSLRPILAGLEQAPAAEAWSYAASSNYGISLRVQNRYKYHFRNGVFQPKVSSEALFDVRVDPNEQQPLSAESHLLTEFRDRVALELRQRATGLYFELINRGDEPLMGSVEARRSLNSRLKKQPGEDLGFHWQSQRQAGFRLEAGHEGIFWIEDYYQGTVGLVLAPGNPRTAAGSSQLRVEFPAEDIDPGRRYCFRDGHWQQSEMDDEEPATFEVKINWRGMYREHASSSPAEIDSQLRDQLEALGYVD